VEQDRTPSVLPHYVELAGPAIGKPRSHSNLIANTTTEAGLRVKAKLDRRQYALAKSISRVDLARVQLKPASFHGEWNYAILPGKI
jgi:hypothetical protein